MSRLSDALNAANTEGWSSREIARRTGGAINHATVARFLNGTHAHAPNDASLRALSDVFGIPIQRVRELAGLRVGEREPYVPPPEANQLSHRQRRAVDEMIRLLAGER